MARKILSRVLPSGPALAALFAVAIGVVVAAFNPSSLAGHWEGDYQTSEVSGVLDLDLTASGQKISGVARIKTAGPYEKFWWANHDVPVVGDAPSEKFELKTVKPGCTFDIVATEQTLDGTSVKALVMDGTIDCMNNAKFKLFGT